MISTGAAALGASALGGLAGLFGGGDQTSTSTTNSNSSTNANSSSNGSSVTNPWAAQSPYLTDLFGKAQTATNDALGSTWDPGQMVANWNTNQQNGVDALVNAGTQGGTAATSTINSGTGLLANGQTATDQYNGLYGASRTDPTAQNVADAGQYINNDLLNGQIDAIGADISRNFNENTLPGIQRGATATGNTNSTRTAIAQGIAQRGAQEDLANTAATIRSNAYSQGLQLAEQARGTNLNGQATAAAGNSGLYTSGVNATTAGTNNALASAEGIYGAGALQHQQDQSMLDANVTKYNNNDLRDLGILAKYQGLIGGNYGSSTTTSNNATTNSNTQNQSTTTSTTPGAGTLASVLGGASSGAGLGLSIGNAFNGTGKK